MSEVRYRSSRRPAGGARPFREVLFEGLAPDGGLYLPERVPPLPSGWMSLEPLPRLAAAVLGGWLPEPRGEELEGLLADALDFPLPLERLGPNLYVLELFHGPTLSFKDFGARVMARLMDALLSGSGRHLTVLAATSGDTGSAVADGFAGRENLDVVLLYPKGRVSRLQERQLTVARPGVRAFAVRGDFDDCQRMVKAALTDPDLAGRVTSANSINVGRLLPQLLFHLWGLRELAARHGRRDAPIVSVPSGNLGNLTAGLLAARAGARARAFLAAHNANRFFPEFLAGRAEAYAYPETVATWSNAMDVGAPSNFERLHHLFGPELPAVVRGYSVDDAATLERMAATWQAHGYAACPHTAVGLEAVERYRSATHDPAPAVVLATASPAKFPEAAQAAGVPLARSEALAALEEAPTRVEELRAEEQALREVLLN